MKKFINIMLCIMLVITACQFSIYAETDTSWKMVTSSASSPDANNEITSWSTTYAANATDMYIFAGSDNSMWLQSQMQIPGDTDKRFFLDFKGLQCDAFVYIKRANSNTYTKVNSVVKGPDAELDISDYVSPNEIVTVKVWITRLWVGMSEQKAKEVFRTSQMAAQNKSEADFQNSSMLGIKHGGISLVKKSNLVNIKNVRIETSVTNKTIKAVITGEKYSAGSGAKIKVSVEEQNGQTANLPSKTVDCNFTNGTQTITMNWQNPTLWELGKGYLYNLRVQVLTATGQESYQYPLTRFGFREIKTDGKKLMLNGHEIRLRLAPFGEGGVASMILYNGIGFNALLIQPNSSYWWSLKWNGLFPTEDYTAQYCSKEMLDYAEQNGWAILMSAPTVDSIGTIFCDEANGALVREEYKEYFTMWMRENDYQNSPSILTWTASMNSGSTYDPEQIGQYPNGSGDRAEINERAARMIKEMDPTRLVYAHHGGKTDKQGSSNDIETLNMYTNFMPIQEVEEYPSVWSKTGDRPWGSCEFGVGFSDDFFNNNRVIPQFTEYLARNFGDDAYAKQDDNYITAVEKLVEQCDTTDYKTRYFKGNDFFKNNKLDGYNTTIYDNLDKWTALGDYWGDYTKRVYRSWRTYDVNYGMFPFNMDIGFGATGNANYGNSLGNTYRELAWISPQEKQALINKPEWASVYYDQFKDAVSPLLTYIGGELYDANGQYTEDFTEKGHNYFAGETVRKSLVTVWDGPDEGNSTNIKLNWTAKLGGQTVSSGTESLTLHAGDIVKTPISFTAPSVSAKSTVTIGLETTDLSNNVLKTDSFDITVFPQAQTAALSGNWAIYDPSGETKSELASYGLNLTSVSIGSSLSNYSVLVIGKGAIKNTATIPYKKADIQRGLKVLVMEQTEKGLQTLGFRTEDNMPRNVFPRDTKTGLLNGLDKKDLSDWRGDSCLLPEETYGEYIRDHAPHWQNTGSVASVTMEIPQMGSFLPVAVAEFDLQYTPLMLFKDGTGEILFCQFDMSGRLNKEPAANVIMNNMISFLNSATVSQSKRVVYCGEQQSDADIISALSFNFAKSSTLTGLDASRDILVVGEMPIKADEILTFANNGGKVLVLPQWNHDLANSNIGSLLGFDDGTLDVSEHTMNLVKPNQITSTDCMNGIGSNLLNFRRNIKLDTFAAGNAGGLVIEKGCSNGGKILFSQLDLRKVCADATSITEVQSVQQPKINAYRFYRQILSNMGAKTSDSIAAHLMN